MKINYKSMTVKFSKTFISIISTTSCSKHLILVRCSSEFQTVVGNFEREEKIERKWLHERLTSWITYLIISMPLLQCQ